MSFLDTKVAIYMYIYAHKKNHSTAEIIKILKNAPPYEMFYPKYPYYIYKDFPTKTVIASLH